MIYKTKEFVSLIKKEALSDKDLIHACNELASGLYDADLGSNVYKKRIAAATNRGKSAGYRTIIGAAIGKQYFFLYIFAKKSKNKYICKRKASTKGIG